MSTQVYLDLLRSFVGRGITADEFEARYLATFKRDPSFHDEPIYELLNSVFGAVDAYCPDEAIRGPEDLGPDELLDAARNALTMLEDLVDKGAR